MLWAYWAVLHVQLDYADATWLIVLEIVWLKVKEIFRSLNRINFVKEIEAHLPRHSFRDEMNSSLHPNLTEPAES